MLTESGEQLLKESFRVLKHKGKIGISTWGRPENSKLFSLPVEILKDMGIENSAGRSFFRYGKIEVLLKLMEETGYKDIVFYYLFTPYNFTTLEDFQSMNQWPNILNMLLNVKEE